MATPSRPLSVAASARGVSPAPRRSASISTVPVASSGSRSAASSGLRARPGACITRLTGGGATPSSTSSRSSSLPPGKVPVTGSTASFPSRSTTVAAKSLVVTPPLSSSATASRSSASNRPRPAKGSFTSGMRRAGPAAGAGGVPAAGGGAGDSGVGGGMAAAMASASIRRDDSVACRLGRAPNPTAPSPARSPAGVVTASPWIARPCPMPPPSRSPTRASSATGPSAGRGRPTSGDSAARSGRRAATARSTPANAAGVASAPLSVIVPPSACAAMSTGNGPGAAHRSGRGRRPQRGGQMQRRAGQRALGLGLHRLVQPGSRKLGPRHLQPGHQRIEVRRPRPQGQRAQPRGPPPASSSRPVNPTSRSAGSRVCNSPSSADRLTAAAATVAASPRPSSGRVAVPFIVQPGARRLERGIHRPGRRGGGIEQPHEGAGFGGQHQCLGGGAALDRPLAGQRDRRGPIRRTGVELPDRDRGRGAGPPVAPDHAAILDPQRPHQNLGPAAPRPPRPGIRRSRAGRRLRPGEPPVRGAPVVPLQQNVRPQQHDPRDLHPAKHQRQQGKRHLGPRDGRHRRPRSPRQVGERDILGRDRRRQRRHQAEPPERQRAAGGLQGRRLDARAPGVRIDENQGAGDREHGQQHHDRQQGQDHAPDDGTAATTHGQLSFVSAEAAAAR